MMGGGTHIGRLVFLMALFFCANASWRETQSYRTYIGGEFSGYSVDGEELIAVAVLEDEAWSPVGTELKRYGEWSSMISNGTTAVVAGNFGWLDGSEVNNIVAFSLDGSGSWSGLGLGVHGRISSVAGYEEVVYVVGQISYCYGEPRIYVSNVAKYDFSTGEWSTVGGGIEYTGALSLESVAVNERGEVFVAGWGVQEQFGVKAKEPVLLWYTSDTDWVSLLYHSDGIFNQDTDNEFNVVVTHGDDLYIGGSFSVYSPNGTVLAANLARWNSGHWYPVGSQAVSGTIYSIVVDDNANVMVSGWFVENLNIVYDNKLYLVDRNRWLKFQSSELLAHPIVHKDVFMFCGYLVEEGVVSIGMYNTSVEEVDEAYRVLDYPYSDFGLDGMLLDSHALLRTVSHVSPYEFILSEYDSSTGNWTSRQDEKVFVAKGTVRDILLDSGGNVVVCGWFSLTDNDKVLNNIAMWNGTAWSSFGSSNGVPLKWSPTGSAAEGIMAMAVAGEGADQAIYIAGKFDYTTDEGQRLVNVAYFNLTSSEWRSMAGGIEEFTGTRAAIVVTSDLVFIGAQFTKTVGNSTFRNLIAWNLKEQCWESSGFAMEGIGGTEDAVYALLIEDSTLYIGGSFKMEVEEHLFTNIIAWDMGAEEWLFSIQATFTSASSINALSYAKGTLYAGGDFVTISGKMANNVASWTSSSGWDNLGNGLVNIDVEALAFNSLTNAMLADGFEEAPSTTHELHAWQLDGDYPYEWNWVTGEIQDWDGFVDVIRVQEYTYVAPWTTWQIILLSVIAVIIVVAAILPLLFLSVFVYKREKRRIYKVLPHFLRDRKQVTLEKILSDSSIPQIPYAQLRIFERIGGGAAGEVLRATWNNLEVAVKRIYLPKHSQDNDAFIRDFLVEVKILSALDHPNVVKFLGISTSGQEDLLLVLELMAYGSLADVLYGTPGLDPLLRIDLMVDAAKGIQYLHSLEPAIIHRDLKPENLLVDKNLRCKVSDFGISTIKGLSKTMTVVGTPLYMAPEVIKKSRQYSTEVDVYAFGILLLEVWTQQKPYSDDRFDDHFPGQIMFLVVNDGLRPHIPPSVPPALARLIEECMEEEPSLRPTFREIIVRLKRVRIVVEHAGERGSLPPQVLGEPLAMPAPGRGPGEKGHSDVAKRRDSQCAQGEESGGETCETLAIPITMEGKKREREEEGGSTSEGGSHEWSLLLSSGTQAYGALSKSYTAVSKQAKSKRRVSSFGDTSDVEVAPYLGHGIN